MKEITVEELKSLLDQNDNIKLLDVREEDEHEGYNISSFCMPLSKIRNMEIDPIEHLREHELILVCNSGVRSMEASLLLDTFGFKAVCFVKGGLKEWQEKYS